jgi:hypothetical protein
MTFVTGRKSSIVTCTSIRSCLIRSTARRHRLPNGCAVWAAGRVSQDAPVNHSATFAPVIQPTLDTGTEALVVAAHAWL